MARERRHRRRRHDRGRFSGLYKVVSVLLIFIALAVACVVFFRVDTITVTGNSRYTDQTIIDVTGIRQGDNLFQIRESKVSRAILSQLPYVQAVSLRRAFPDGVVITVSEGEAAAALEDGARWWLLGENGKLLEEVDDPAGYPTVTGLTPLAPAAGTYLTPEKGKERKAEELKELLAALEDHGILSETGTIDLSDDYEIVFTCDGRFTVYLSTTLEQGMDYWVRRFAVNKEHPSVERNQSYEVFIRDGKKMPFVPN